MHEIIDDPENQQNHPSVPLPEGTIPLPDLDSCDTAITAMLSSETVPDDLAADRPEEPADMSRFSDLLDEILPKYKNHIAPLKTLVERALGAQALVKDVDDFGIAVLEDPRVLAWHNAVIVPDEEKKSRYVQLMPELEAALDELRNEGDNLSFTIERLVEKVQSVRDRQGEPGDPVHLSTLNNLLTSHPGIVIGAPGVKGRMAWQHITFMNGEKRSNPKSDFTKQQKRARKLEKAPVSFYPLHRVFENSVLPTEVNEISVKLQKVSTAMTIEGNGGLLIAGGNETERQFLQDLAEVIYGSVLRIASQREFNSVPKSMVRAEVKNYLEGKGMIYDESTVVLIGSFMGAHSRMTTASSKNTHLRFTPTPEELKNATNAVAATAEQVELAALSPFELSIRGKDAEFVQHALLIEAAVIEAINEAMMDGNSSESKSRFMPRVSRRVAIPEGFESVVDASLRDYCPNGSEYVQFPKNVQPALHTKGRPVKAEDLRAAPFARRR